MLATGLAIAGVMKTFATRGNYLRSSLENILIPTAGGVIAYGIGYGFDLLLISDHID